MNNLKQLIPSTSMLLAFESSARHTSFTRAADELSLTPSAISRQVLALEQLLDVQLFVRSGRMLQLTEVGRRYALDLVPALARIHGASSRAMAFRGGSSQLQLASLPTFTSRWLMPRLAGYYEAHQDTVVHLHARAGEFKLDSSGLDAAINVGVEPFPGLISHRLFDEDIVLVGSPAALRRHPVRTPKDVRHHLLLLNAYRLEAWRAWFDQQGLSTRLMRPGPQFEITLHQIQAAAAGVGLALVARTLVAEELDSGRLVQPPVPGLPGKRGYHLLYPPDKSDFAPLVTFRAWLLSQLDGQPPS